MKTVLNLGAGIQSTTLYLMGLRGELHFDTAIFADVGDEPAPVYAHLDWLKSLHGPPIVTVRQHPTQSLSDFLIKGSGTTSSKRFVSIPAFLLTEKGASVTKGQLRRQCTEEFKIKPIERYVRKSVLGLKHGQRASAQSVTSLYGISLDEAGRAIRIRQNSPKWNIPTFPLIERMMSREDCHKWLKAYPVPHKVPKSACVFCPFRRNQEWRWLRENDPAGWEKAVALDRLIREHGGARCTERRRSVMFLHDERIPLDQVDIEKDPPGQALLGFNLECLGMCGM